MSTKHKLDAPKPMGAKSSTGAALKRFLPLLTGERNQLVLALVAMLVSSGATLVAPLIISHAIDTHIRLKDNAGLVASAGLLLLIYGVGVVGSYMQVVTMGSIGRRVLYRLRNALFAKLQDLPLAFFTENKAGDLISRVNNDTDKLNQFLGQSLMQFLGSLFLMSGAAVFVLSIDWRLGFVALLPALGVVVFTKATGAWVKRRNVKSLASLGGLSSEIQESLHNFKVIIASNRLDYFQRKFGLANDANYASSVSAGFANNLFFPLYGLASHLAQLSVLAYGIVLIGQGHQSAGVVVGFLLYVNSFYGTLRQLASVWQSFQLALAALDRVSEVLALENTMPLIPGGKEESDSLLEFRGVDFQYPNGKEVLKNVSFALERGKAYALVGPTGGGKTTTASLMARLYDATSGSVRLDGREIQSIPAQQRTSMVGFIPQEPFLFSGTVHDNIVYANDRFEGQTPEQVEAALEQSNLTSLLARFPEGLSTKVASSGNTISLGQKQIIAFMRAVLRQPKLLILDEATANIDTVTEQILDEILARLPSETTKVIIAHRLNTINNVDQIFFINSGRAIPAGSMEHAVDMLLHEHRQS